MQGMAGVERLLHFGACHHAFGFAKANLLLIEDESVGESDATWSDDDEPDLAALESSS